MEPLRETPLGNLRQYSDNHGVKNARSLAASALQAAHRVADGALEVQHLPTLSRVPQAGAEIADAGISALAHLACAATAAAGPGMAKGREFTEAAKHLEHLRTLLIACESRGLIDRMDLAPLSYAIDEAIALTREAEAGLEASRSGVA